MKAFFKIDPPIIVSSDVNGELNVLTTALFLNIAQISAARFGKLLGPRKENNIVLQPGTHYIEISSGGNFFRDSFVIFFPEEKMTELNSFRKILDSAILTN